MLSFGEEFWNILPPTMPHHPSIYSGISTGPLFQAAENLNVGREVG